MKRNYLGQISHEFTPPILPPGEETKDDCDRCKVYKVTAENMKAEISKLSKVQDENQKLRRVIKDLLVETGQNPGNFEHLLTSAKNGGNDKMSAENSDEDPEKHCAAQKALLNSLILRKVFQHLDDLRLLKLRPVCKLWAEEASDILRVFKYSSFNRNHKTGPGLQVRILFNSLEKTLGKTGVGPLSNLLNLMNSGVKAGRKFPCSTFSLTCPNLRPPWAVPEAVELLEKFGGLMESLILEIVPHQNSTLNNRNIVESLRRLLFKWTPNLKYFRFKIAEWPNEYPVRLLYSDECSDSLPNLQILYWLSTRASSFPVFRDILRISPNLKNILNFPPMDEVIEADKADAIKEVHVGFSSPNCRLALEAEHCFNVEEIQVNYDLKEGFDRRFHRFSYPQEWRSKTQLLNTILYNNRRCLTKLRCQNLGPLAGCDLEVPEMPNLKTLEIKTIFDLEVLAVQNLSVQDFFRIFPKELDVPSTFPNLAQISWKIEVLRDYSILGRTWSVQLLYLPVWDVAMGQLTSVRSLTFNIQDNRNIHYLQRIAVCLPNVKVLHIDYGEKCDPTWFDRGSGHTFMNPGFPDIFRIIWEFFQGVEEIHLFPCLKEPPKDIFLKDCPAQLVDSAITGLDVETVGKLARNCSDNMRPEFTGTGQTFTTDQENFIEAPSILNMKSLRYLKISLQKANDFPILTHISGTHGFGLLMSKLTVIIEAEGEKHSVIDDPKGLMSPNVNFKQMPRKRVPEHML